MYAYGVYSTWIFQTSISYFELNWCEIENSIHRSKLRLLQCPLHNTKCDVFLTILFPLWGHEDSCKYSHWWIKMKPPESPWEGSTALSKKLSVGYELRQRKQPRDGPLDGLFPVGQQCSDFWSLSFPNTLRSMGPVPIKTPHWHTY